MLLEGYEIEIGRSVDIQLGYRLEYPLPILPLGKIRSGPEFGKHGPGNVRPSGSDGFVMVARFRIQKFDSLKRSEESEFVPFEFENENERKSDVFDNIEEFDTILTELYEIRINEFYEDVFFRFFIEFFRTRFFQIFGYVISQTFETLSYDRILNSQSSSYGMHVEVLSNEGHHLVRIVFPRRGISFVRYETLSPYVSAGRHRFNSLKK